MFIPQHSLSETTVILGASIVIISKPVSTLSFIVGFVIAAGLVVSVSGLSLGV